nr:MAG TPA: hypothetical protein [Caudoviricetes sp.]
MATPCRCFFRSDSAHLPRRSRFPPAPAALKMLFFFTHRPSQPQPFKYQDFRRFFNAQ